MNTDKTEFSSVQQRFGGIGRLYGQESLEKLHKFRICVIGIGGVGSWVAESLARSACGYITLIDLDEVCTTNINRQIHALSETVGHSKIQVMAKRIASINPECKVECIEDFITVKNIETYIDSQFDYVIDCIDSVKPKTALLNHCIKRKIPVISIGGAGGKIDPTKILIDDLSRSHNDPLLAKVRSLLRRDYGFTRNTKRKFRIPVVFSTEQLRYPNAEGGVSHEKQFLSDSIRLDCAGGIGAASFVTASFGFVAVSKVLKDLLLK